MIDKEALELSLSELRADLEEGTKDIVDRGATLAASAQRMMKGDINQDTIANCIVTIKMIKAYQKAANTHKDMELLQYAAKVSVINEHYKELSAENEAVFADALKAVNAAVIKLTDASGEKSIEDPAYGIKAIVSSKDDIEVVDASIVPAKFKVVDEKSVRDSKKADIPGIKKIVKKTVSYK